MDKFKAITLLRTFRWEEGSSELSSCAVGPLSQHRHTQNSQDQLSPTSHTSKFSQQPCPCSNQLQIPLIQRAETRSQLEGTAYQYSPFGEGADGRVGDLQGAVPQLWLHSGAPRREARRKSKRILFNCHLNKCLISSFARKCFPSPPYLISTRDGVAGIAQMAFLFHVGMTSTQHRAPSSLKRPDAPLGLQTQSTKHTMLFLSFYKDMLTEKCVQHACTVKPLPGHSNVNSVYGSVIQDVVKYFLKSSHLSQSKTLYFMLLGGVLLNYN